MQVFRLYGDLGRNRGPIQLKVIIDSQVPTSKKRVQQLIDCLAALKRFISHFTNRLKPFFITLRGAKRVGWNEECDQAFMKIKQYLTESPILASLETGETFYLYLIPTFTTFDGSVDHYDHMHLLTLRVTHPKFWQ